MRGPVIILLILFLQISCTRTVYVPVESTRTEYRDNFLRDSVHIHDSIYIHGRNDTLWVEKYRTVYQDRIRIDSIFRQDTIRIPYPVDKISYRNKTTWYQDILIYSGLGAIALLMLWLIKRRI